MKWTIEEIRTFLDVMETGTVSGAAARSNLSKSVISKRIADLEAALGAALFRRHAGRITPTESAEELALRLRPVLTEMTNAVESAAWGMAGLRGVACDHRADELRHSAFEPGDSGLRSSASGP